MKALNLSPLVGNGVWIPVKDADDRARALYERHYSCYHYRDGRARTKFVGPGEYMVLLTLECDALFVWRKFIDASGQKGVNCAAFRNEGDKLSSFLIIEAMKMAWGKWPDERLYTYVNPKRILSSNPGYCFMQAGWNKCGLTQKGLQILEVLHSTQLEELKSELER